MLIIAEKILPQTQTNISHYLFYAQSLYIGILASVAVTII